MADPQDVRRVRLREQRRRRAELKARFCRFWNMTPRDYDQLTVDELEAMTKLAEEEIADRKRAQRKTRARSRRRR